MAQILAIDNFAGGVHNREVPENIAPNELADASNLLLSNGGLAEPRMGHTALGGTCASVLSLGVFQRNDGTETIVVRVGNKLKKFVSPSTWTEITKGGGDAFATGGDRTCFVNWNNYLYIMDGSNFMKWDGTTLADVAHGLGVAFYPRYGCGHGTRLFVGNYNYDGTNYPNRVAFCSAWDDTNWETSAVMNELYYDYEVTGLVSSGNLLVGMRQAVFMVWDDVNLDGTAYFPSQRLLAPVGVLPWTMVKCNKDVYFANQTGVYSISATQNFGDLEAGRISYKIDKTFEDYFSTSNQDKCCAFYFESRDEYWLSIPGASGYKTLVGKVSLPDGAGRIPWMPQSLSFRDWCYKPGTNDVLFANSANVWKYGGRSDGSATDTGITCTFTSATFGRERYERKRLALIDAQAMRWGSRIAPEIGTVYLYTDDTICKSFAFQLDTDETATPVWGTAGLKYGDGSTQYAISGAGKQTVSIRHRLAAYARLWYLKWSYKSSISGATISRMKVTLEETGR